MSADGEFAGSGRLPLYLAAMVRREPPDSAGVVPAATLGINPSRSEFLDGQGRVLDGSQRRLATPRSLAATLLDELTDEQVAEC